MKKLFISLFALLLLGSTAFVQGATYTLAGEPEAVFGSAWDPSNTANDMILDDGLYKFVKNDVVFSDATTVKFKVCQDHAWTNAWPSDNYVQDIAAGTYNLIFTFDESSKNVNLIIEGGYVGAHGDMTSSSWATVEFTPSEDKKTASHTYTLSAGTYHFGMRIGGSNNWTSNGASFTREDAVKNIVSGSGNCSFVADIDGDYTFTWNYATNILNITYPTESTPISHTYTVAGSSAAAFGTAWAPSNTDNDMTLVGETYQWSKSDIELAAGTVSFKVCQDHAWDISWPSANYDLAISDNGIYTITISFDASSKEILATATKTEDAEIIPNVWIHGDFSGDWATSEAFTIAEGNESASLEMSLTAGTYNFGMRIAETSNWTANGYVFKRAYNSAEVTGSGSNCELQADVDGNYTFTWTYATNTLAITYPDATVQTYHLYVRNLTKWSAFNVYAWGTEQYFGDWPGKAAADNTAEIDGISYNVYDFEAIEGATIEMNLIFHQDDADENRQSLTLTEARNCTITVADIAAWEGASAVKRFRPYMPMEHVYGYQFDEFGTVGEEWPGAELTADSEGWYEFIVNKGRAVVFSINEGAIQTGDIAYTDEDPVADECVVWQGETSVYEEKTYMTTSADCNAALPETYIRSSLTIGNYGTICLPFSAIKVEGASLFSIDGKDGEDGTGIFLKEETQLLKGVPYIFLAEADQLTVYYWAGQDFEPSSDNLYTSNGLVGYISDAGNYTVTPNAHNFILYNNGLYFVDSDAQIYTNRAFIDWSNVPVAGPSGAPRRYVGIHQMPTGIENVQSDNVQCTKFMENGQLFIMYKGTKYNAQGQTIK